MLGRETPLSCSYEVTEHPEAENAKSKSTLEERKQKKTLIAAVREKLPYEQINTVIYNIAF